MLIMSETVLSFDSVDFSYGSGARRQSVLRKASFKVRSDEVASVIGPNGSGKSTLMKLALGILKPQQGQIQILGQSPEKARMKVGYTPQHIRFDANFPIRVADVVLMGGLTRKMWGFWGKQDKKNAMLALERLEVGDLWNRNFSELSGGQQQRILIARAIVSSPQLLLLDEPTANIDPKGESRFQEIVKELSRTMTIVVISHDLGFVSKLVNRIICVDREVRSHVPSEITPEVLHEIYGDSQIVRHHHHGADCCGNPEELKP
jgi:zinc transport system ATP-binding protein